MNTDDAMKQAESVRKLTDKMNDNVAHTPDDKYQWVGAIHTNSGKTFDIINPTIDMIDIEDIAHALAMQCRYNGHVPSFYSVAEHSVRVSDWLYEQGYPDYAFRGLMHDASETYIGDIVRPMKQLPEFGGMYKEFEAKIEGVIGERYVVTLFPMNPIVAAADKAVYEWEVEDIRSGNISGWDWGYAKNQFLERFERYCLTRDMPNVVSWSEARSRIQHPSVQGTLNKIIDKINDNQEEELESMDDGLLYADVAEDGTIWPNFIDYGSTVAEINDTITENMGDYVDSPDSVWPSENPFIINYSGPPIKEDAIEKFRELFNRGIKSVSEEFGEVTETTIQGTPITPEDYLGSNEDPMFEVPVLIESRFTRSYILDPDGTLTVTYTEVNNFKED